MLLYLECYKKLLSKGVNVLLRQPVHAQNSSNEQNPIQNKKKSRVY